MRWVFPLFTLVIALPGVAVAAAPEVRASPARVVLGQDSAVELEVRVPPESGPVRAAASSGSFAQAVVEGGPVRRFQWLPPEVRYPLPAVLVFWVDRPSGPPEVAVVRIPLIGRTTLPISTDRGAQVVIEIAGARFGPVKANSRGKVQVPVEVPPGVGEARVLATRGTLETERQVKIDVPDHRPLVAVLTVDPLPRAGGWLVVAGEEGLGAEALRLTAEGARLEPQPGSPLLYRVSPEEGARTVTVEARRRDGKDTARAQVAVQQVDPPAPPAPPVLPPPPAPPAAVAVAAAPAEPAAPVPSRLAAHLLAGGFFAGGANRGPAVALGASYALPLWDDSVAAEVEVGLRSAGLEARIEGHGTLRSRVLAGPVLAAARLTLLERPAFALYSRAGAGVLPFQHEVSSDFQPDFGERQLSPLVFLATQGALRFNRLSLLLELRGEYGPARTARLDAQLGGVSLSLGMRYGP